MHGRGVKLDTLPCTYLGARIWAQEARMTPQKGPQEPVRPPRKLPRRPQINARKGYEIKHPSVHLVGRTKMGSRGPQEAPKRAPRARSTSQKAPKTTANKCTEGGVKLETFPCTYLEPRRCLAERSKMPFDLPKGSQEDRK